MRRTSGGTDLRTRLQQKVEQDRQQIEEVMQSEHRKLEESLKRSVGNVLDTIESDTRRLSEALRRAWIGPLAIGLMLVLAMAGGSWGLMGWLSHSIESHIRTRAVLQVEIEEQRRTVERLKEKTWGVVLHEGKEGRKFVVLPKGSLDYPPWTVGGRPAVSLSSE